MANGTSRYGNALLALTTNRPPDPDRGAGIVHLELALPETIATQVSLWETGGRGPLDPRETAQLLWAVPVASYLNGHPDAWLDVPRVGSLLPGLAALATTDQNAWPEDQAALRHLVAQAAPGNPSWDVLSDQLNSAGTVGLLNDLVLIFKYAAVHQRRPLRTAADLYRLARALTASTNGPATFNEVTAWLTAPLVVARPLTAPSGAPGPRPPAPASPQSPAPPGRGPGGPSRVPQPHLPHVDLESPRAVAVLGRLDSELNRIERLKRGTSWEASSVHPTVSSSIQRDAGRQRARIVQAYVYGTPVLVDVAQAEARTARLRHAMAVRIVESLPGDLRDRLKNAGVALEDLEIWPDLIAAVTPSPSYLEPVGRSDLLLVRQTTTGYRRAEIAYVENVLIGETRERAHTNRMLTRQEFFESVERETEETRDLQATDRAELSREVSRVVSEDLRAEGSVEVTSRGPTKVVASAEVSYERSTEEAAKTAEEYARETIERAVKRTMERVTRQTRSLFEQETTEVNRHSFARDSSAPDHVSGVYQYLERVSRAKIFWYGERELYDLLIPEPASLIWQLAISRKELHLPLEAPDADLFASLTVANIAERREDVIRAFRVTDLPVVPEENRQVAISFSDRNGKYATSKEVQIPEGYVVTNATFVISAEVEGNTADEPNGGVAVGGEVRLWSLPRPEVPGDLNQPGFLNELNQGATGYEFEFSMPIPGPTVAVAVNADNYSSLAGNITLTLELTDEARHNWALAAYGRVAERYEQLRREYAQAVIQASANQPADVATLPMGSRLRLQQVVRFELQRAAVDIMRNAAVNYDLIDSFPYANVDGSLGSHPTVEIQALHAAEPEVRFLQQAFEWEHLGWILYPYFWGRRGEWSRTVVTAHPDPDFEAFLNAGAARLQIPVRPGFENLVKHFMETGEVYEGDGLPKMGDPGYVTFIDEQLTSLGAPGDEVPWPPAAPREWDVLAPASLLLVRSLTNQPDQLPRWDPQTGEELDRA